MQTLTEKRDFVPHGRAVTPAVSATQPAGHSILELQRKIGNRSVGELLRATADAGVGVASVGRNPVEPALAAAKVLRSGWTAGHVPVEARPLEMTALRTPRQKCPACQDEELQHAHERPREGDVECFPEPDADTASPSEELAAMPHEVTGTPVSIDSDANSIICKGQTLVVQNNNTAADSSCTQAHENNHIADWKGRYGNDLCKGVADGKLPVGGPGYDAFLKGSECKAYRVGKTCRENLLKTAAASDKPAIQSGIDRDNTQIGNYC